MPDIGLFPHDMGEVETCDENIYILISRAAHKTAGCGNVRTVAVLVLDDQCNWVLGL